MTSALRGLIVAAVVVGTLSGGQPVRADGPEVGPEIARDLPDEATERVADVHRDLPPDAPGQQAVDGIADLKVLEWGTATDPCPSIPNQERVTDRYLWIPKDLNEGAGGARVYLCVGRGRTPAGGFLSAIKATESVQAGNQCGDGWTWIDVNLNARVPNGGYVYFCYQREAQNSARPITGISIWVGKVLQIVDPRGGPCGSPWTWVSTNLNSRTRVEAPLIFLCYRSV